MSSFRIFNRQSRRIAAALTLLFATVVPGLVPAFVSAAQITARSIELSSSSVSATGVTYNINFTPIANAGAFVVEFCNDSPLYGADCTKPTGINLASAASTTSGFTDVSVIDDADDNTLVVAGSMTASTPVSVAVTGITNPSVAGTMYARIATFDTDAHADAYVSNPTEPAINTGVIDTGSVAISINATIGVSGDVLESLTFCVSAGVIAANCSGATAPVLELGELTGTVRALTPTAVSTGNIHTQISTNAVSGAIVSLKGSNACGGLKRANVATCDIAPALQTGVALGEAKFGVLVNANSSQDTTTSASGGAFRAFPASGYNGSTYALNWDDDDETGITSTFGDKLLDTSNVLASNRNMTLTFGASVAPNTPAGKYATDLSLIATGKF